MKEKEIFLYSKNIKNDTDFNIWFCFPSNYIFGMSALGFLYVYKLFDLQQNYFVERIFTDTEKTKLQFNQVDLMGFSVSFEIDFLAIFTIFDKYKIPYKSFDRGAEYPLIFGGGPVLSSNPEPYSAFFDFIVVGDGEGVNLAVSEVIRTNKNLAKKEILKKLSQIEGVYVPSLTKFDVERNIVTDLKGNNIEIRKQTSGLSECVCSPILTEKSFFSNTFIIEVARGCPQKCRFCLASYLNLPYRCADFDEIISNIDLGLKHTNKLALLGALVSAHPRFDDICDYIYQKIQNGQHIELSISSLRVNRVSEKVIQTLVACGQKHVTVAFEAGSERLRKVINKNLTEHEIFDFVELAQKNGLKGLKIYAMIGLPTETEEDIKELIDLMKRLKNHYKQFDFTISFATFVPKAHTPFQYCARENTKSLEKKYSFIKKNLSKIGIKVRVSSVKWDDVQTILSRGDRRFCDYAVEVYKKGANLGAFKKVYKEMVKKQLLPPLEEIVFASKDIDKNLPWDFIKMSPELDNLRKDYTNSMQ